MGDDGDMWVGAKENKVLEIVHMRIRKAYKLEGKTQRSKVELRLANSHKCTETYLESLKERKQVNGNNDRQNKECIHRGEAGLKEGLVGE